MAAWQLRERFAADGGAIAWDRLGDGPPVVLVHGTPWSSWTWRRVAAALAERHSVFVFDHLGFGASEQHAGQDVSLAAHGARFAALLGHWGLERPAFVAHDIGGAIALRAHLLHGRAVASLALLDVVALAPWGSPSSASCASTPPCSSSSRRRSTTASCAPTSAPRSRIRSRARSRTRSSRPGRGRRGSRPSTARSPTATSATRTRSSRATATSRCPRSSSGATPTRGSRSSAAGSWPRGSRARGSRSCPAPATSCRRTRPTR